MGLIRFTALAVLAAGVLSCVFFAPEVINAEYSILLTELNVYLDGVGLAGNKLAYFLQRALYYGGTIAVVWFLAFVPPACVLSYGILFLKSYGLTFTVMCLYHIKGWDGLIYAIVLMGPQNLIFMPVCCYAVCGCVRQGMGQIRAWMISRGARFKEAGTRIRLSKGRSAGDYGYCMLLGTLASVAAAFIEVWITPLLLAIIYVRGG